MKNLTNEHNLPYYINAIYIAMLKYNAVITTNYCDIGLLHDCALMACKQERYSQAMDVRNEVIDFITRYGKYERNNNGFRRALLCRA